MIGPDRAVRLGLGELGGEPAGIAHEIVRVRIGRRRHFDELGTGEAQHVLLFLALGLGDHDHRLEAHRGPDQREPDAGIASRALDDGPARLQLAARDGVADDEQRGAILDRLARVHELGLAEDVAARRLGDGLEPHEGGIADEPGKIVITSYSIHYTKLYEV